MKDKKERPPAVRPETGKSKTPSLTAQTLTTLGQGRPQDGALPRADVHCDRVIGNLGWSFTKQCVQRQQGCLQCCRASCRLGVESTAEVVHKSAVATWYASEQKDRTEICRLLLTDF